MFFFSLHQIMLVDKIRMYNKYADRFNKNPNTIVSKVPNGHPQLG